MEDFLDGSIEGSVSILMDGVYFKFLQFVFIIFDSSGFVLNGSVPV